MEVPIKILNEDAMRVSVDVLALKYAQANYGLDAHVTKILIDGGRDPSLMRPKAGGFRLVDGVAELAASRILFVGVVPLYTFGYPEIREFSRRVLSTLAGSTAKIRRVALTLHGAGYGLDELEAFEAEVAGVVDSIRTLDFPELLSEILFVEGNRGRASRLAKRLKELLPSGTISAAPIVRGSESIAEDSERLRSAGYSSSSKQHIFVAMPFKKEMNDHYHYGIQGAVHDAGFLCERADLSSFTGDVVQWVRERIRTAKLVVADLTDGNPNVYLEVGYAWGCNIPTVLLVKDTKDLKFDVRSQRCLAYSDIQELEQSLAKELNELKKNGTI
jgi:hypothetical protein